MIVHVYSLCWNEARMIPYYLRHYESIVDQFFIFDDNSRDDSLKLLNAHPKVQIDRFEKTTDSLVESAQIFQNEIWKKSRGKADWVIICAMDEHLYHPDMLNYLQHCKGKGITVLPAKGFQMVSDSFNPSDDLLCESVTRGARYRKMDKTALFNPNAVEEINYSPGRHNADPTGDVVYPHQTDIRLLHYKYLGLDYLTTRHAELRTGLLHGDIEKRWGNQYLWDKETLNKKFHSFSNNARRVLPYRTASRIKPIDPQSYRFKKHISKYAARWGQWLRLRKYNG